MTLLLLVAVCAFFYALLLGMAGYERLTLRPERDSGMPPETPPGSRDGASPDG